MHGRMYLEVARRTMRCEAEAIRVAADRLDTGLIAAVDLILGCAGKVVLSGVGKSGLIGRKIASTLSSTGCRACFVHPTEAMHGDLGMYSAGDVSILLSNSGTTSELLRLVPLLRQYESPQIGILGNSISPLAREMDVVLDASVQCEADPCNVAPTSSTAVALALGDALASALMQARGFTREHFAQLHPGGKLGRDLRVTVADVMHQGTEVAWVHRQQPLREVVIAMTHHPLGAALVVDSAFRLQGLITDGDVRRTLEKHEEIRGIRAEQVMTRTPTSVGPKATLREALVHMENRASQISVLPVLQDDGCCIGLVRIHDLYTSLGGR